MSILKEIAREAVSKAARTTNKIIPGKARRFIAESWLAGSHPDKRFACPVCDSAVGYFKPMPAAFLDRLAEHDYAHAYFQTETMNFSQYMCPRCGASDRDRLYILYLRQRLANKDARFIDFAPNWELSRAIKSIPGIVYRSADLFDPKADDVVDITAIPYEAGSVDAFLCSHILEHVPDDKLALRELHKMLRPGGFGIIMVPLVGIDKTLENPSTQSEADRWKWHGQGDHVRQYAKTDFVSRIEDAGFKVSQLGEDYFTAPVFEVNGIHKRSVLYVAEKAA